MGTWQGAPAKKCTRQLNYIDLSEAARFSTITYYLLFNFLFILFLRLSWIFSIILSQILSPAVSEFTNPPQEGGRRPCHFRLRLAAAEFLLRDYCQLRAEPMKSHPQPLDCLIDLFIDRSRYLRPRRQLSIRR